MADSPKRDWKVLAEMAAHEQDPSKLLKIVTELNAALQERERTGRRSRPRRVLVMDDDLNVRDTLLPVLQTRGYETEFAYSIPSAINAVKNRTFDAFICDLNIEKENDGLSVATAMREAHPQCVVILLTGHPGFDSAVEGIRQKVDDYLTKPTDYDKLIGVLEARLASKPGV